MKRFFLVFLALAAVMVMVAGCATVRIYQPSTANSPGYFYGQGYTPEEVTAVSKAYLNFQKGQNMTPQTAAVIAPADRTTVSAHFYGRLPEPEAQPKTTPALSPQQQRAKILYNQMIGK
ncbi:MAG TPA: hypothetical protein PKZ16_00345 [bacterium]|nr:hypothetical protein [bacterium]HPL95865.1 hypothetical protein [bacterium]